MKFWTRLATIASFFGFVSSAFAGGAIVVDVSQYDDEPLYSITTGGGPFEGLQQAALADCQKNGGTNCQPAGGFEKCGAYVLAPKGGKTFGSSGYGSSKKDAELMALGACGQGCKILVSHCE